MWRCSRSIEEVEFLPHYDFAKEAAAAARREPGDWVLAFSNQFQIAMRDEPMSVQRGVISAYADLRGRRGVFDAPFTGDVYFLDAIACNPGAAGGIVTNRKGELLGIIGRELKDTRIRYLDQLRRADPGRRRDVSATTRPSRSAWPPSSRRR